MVRAILSAPGSRGDVNPMIAIGKQLQDSGVEVVISLAENYAHVAEGVGLRVAPVISRARFDEAIGNANVWRPIHGPIAIFRDVAPEFLESHDQVIRENHIPGETILVSHPLDLASRVFRDAHRSTPQAVVHLQPSILRTYNEPPRLSPWWFEVSRPAWLVKSLYGFVDHVCVDPVIRPSVNRLRAKHGLAPIRRILDRWWHDADRILAMYPKWYAPATADYCDHLVHCGFPLADIDGEAFDRPTDKPIVFTSGTAHHHCREFFELAVNACRQLNRSGILLSTHTENFPESLPETVKAMPYLSLRELLPHCGAIVHHGGIGTTSQAIAAGIPQVIRPLAFDQFDNAARVERLGVGSWLRRDNMMVEVLRQASNRETGATLGASKILEDYAGELDSATNAAETAAKQILSMLESNPR